MLLQLQFFFGGKRVHHTDKRTLIARRTKSGFPYRQENSRRKEEKDREEAQVGQAWAKQIPSRKPWQTFGSEFRRH